MILFFIRFLTIKKGIIFDSGSKSVGKTYIILRKIVSYTYLETSPRLGILLKERREKMREEEKIFAGKMFDPRRQELKDIKHTAHEACQKFNQTDEYDPARQELLRNILGKCGETFYCQGPIQFNYGCHTFIGENFFANFNFTVMDDARVLIGNNVAIGPNVSLMATNHPLIASERMGVDDQGRTTMAEFASGIHIGNNVWIASNTVVIDGVHIGDNSVIGAGRVVTKDTPAGYLAYGNPCRPIRPITENDSKRHLILEEDIEHFRYNL